MPVGLHILVVDDDRDLADTFAEVLAADGHVVAVARDGASATALLRERPVDAVLLDLNLPDIRGYDLALALRDGILADTATIIMLTGDMHVELDRANAVGVDIVLIKPVDALVLSRLIEFVRKRRRRKFSLMPLRVASSV